MLIKGENRSHHNSTNFASELEMKYQIASKWEKHGGRRGISRYEERYCECIRPVGQFTRCRTDGLLLIVSDSKSYWIRICFAPLPFAILQFVVFAVDFRIFMGILWRRSQQMGPAEILQGDADSVAQTVAENAFVRILLKNHLSLCITHIMIFRHSHFG